MTIREMLEKIESEYLSPFACLSSNTRGRKTPLVKCDVRTEFQRDRDRILHSKAFRRLKDKTQVFLAPVGDHYRTRLTHTLEVSQIARTISKALRLNEDLTEAITLGHDLGHTPFGHAGEAALNEIYSQGFRHNEQSLRVVDMLERNGQGLNLTFEVRDGILKHSKGKDRIDSRENLPFTLEGRVVRIADIIAYVNHDIEDAIRAGIISQSDLPRDYIQTVGDTHGARIDIMVKDVVKNSLDSHDIKMGRQILDAVEGIRQYLYTEVYPHEQILMEIRKATKALRELFYYYIENPHEILVKMSRNERDDISRIVCDFVAGMSDKMALNTYEQIFLPHPWNE
ncbi:deoxyguanosinetriphosphate triphosphohydrolase [Candidatus Poribacteria bacterium]|nr:deoxyguanosinetriphosphate triphosphohydrolase [Candidatus Poribacteria bacterium]